MARHATTGETVTSASAPTSQAFTRVAFAVWSAAFAIGALIHSWQFSQPPTVVDLLVVLAAFAVILRPAAVARLVVLFGMLFVELIDSLPNPVNHSFVVGTLGVTFGAWWLWLAWRSPAQAHDPAVMYERVAPYLRVAFIMTCLFAAVAKLNSGFLDTVATCSTWILEGIPGVEVPLALAPPVVAGTLALELTIPALLLFHRTRPLAVVLGFGFHLVSAFAGHSAFSGLAWSFYLLFMPPLLLARAVVVARRGVPSSVRAAVAVAVARGPLTLAALGAVWVLAVGAVWLLPEALHWPARRWGAVLVCAVWMGAWAWLLFRLRSHWIGAPGPRASLRVRNGIMLFGLGLIVVTAAMPYLGLKTRAAFTMYSNIRTEPGHWNHLLIPESARMFRWQDGEARFIGTDTPELAVRIDEERSEHATLLGLRRLAVEFPAATVRYELDGVTRVAAPVSSDPVLGAPLSPAQVWLGAMRPYVEGGTCQH